MINDSLRAAIESAHVAHEGLSHPLRIVEVKDTSSGKAVEITVETAHEGATSRASCCFDEARLSDPRDVTATLAHEMHEALVGVKGHGH